MAQMAKPVSVPFGPKWLNSVISFGLLMAHFEKILLLIEIAFALDVKTLKLEAKSLVFHTCL